MIRDLDNVKAFTGAERSTELRVQVVRNRRGWHINYTVDGSLSSLGPYDAPVSLREAFDVVFAIEKLTN